MKKLFVIVAALVVVPVMVMAGDNAAPPTPQELTAVECGACHMAYPARFLPALSWQTLLGDLPNHFGEDASLDAESTVAIESYLTENSQKGQLVDAEKPPLRITELRWFVHEHGEHEATRMKENRNVKTMSDCVACHAGAS